MVVNFAFFRTSQKTEKNGTAYMVEGECADEKIKIKSELYLVTTYCFRYFTSKNDVLGSTCGPFRFFFGKAEYLLSPVLVLDLCDFLCHHVITGRQ